MEAKKILPPSYAVALERPPSFALRRMQTGSLRSEARPLRMELDASNVYSSAHRRGRAISGEGEAYHQSEA